MVKEDRLCYNDRMGELTDLLASLSGKLGRWMNIKGRRICFIIWAFVMVYWMMRNYSLGLMVQTGGCFISLIMDIYGYINWKKEKIGK